MRTPRGFAFVIVLCVSHCGVAAATDAVQPAAKPEAAPAAAAKDPVVCRKVKETGSRASGKEVCMTASQWEQQKKNSRDVMNSIPGHNVGGNAGN
jgi:hypothetical protein